MTVGSTKRSNLGHGVDFLAIGAGASIASLGSLALVALAHYAWRPSPETGPTAATLQDGFRELLAAGAGVCIGCAVASALSRRGPIRAGIISGALACLLVLVPALILTLPDDVTSDEMPGFAVLGVLLLSPFVLVGTLLGAILRVLIPNRGTA